MGRVRRKDTDLEQTVRSALHRKGYRFRKHVKGLPGTPDLVFTRHKLAVFLDGNFWHGYDFDSWKDKLKPFWRAKIERNMERDAQNVNDLEALGWRVLRIWQYEVKRDLPGVLARVERLLAPVVNAL